MVDRTRALKLEAPYEGGTQLDTYPCDVNPNQDGLDARAFFAQSDTSSDSQAFVSRSGSDLTLTDANAGTKNAQDLVSRVLGSVAGHESLPSGTHFLGAPCEGWATPYFVPTYTGPLLTGRAWYTNSGQTQLIFRQVITYTGVLVSQVVSTIFGPTGATIRTITDSYAYFGPMLVNVSRSWV